MSRAKMLATIGAVLAMTTAAWAVPVSSIEDLDAAELPHGIVVLPRQGSVEARTVGGCIFRFSDAAFQEIPEKNHDEGANGLFQAVREGKLGDLTYSPMNDGTFIAWSGRIADLGEGFLYELDGKDLAEPPIVYSVEERSGATGKGYEGFLEHLAEGHRYLVQTTDGKFALIRLLEKGDEKAVIQWIFQPNGSRLFQVADAKEEHYKAQLHRRNEAIQGDEDKNELDESNKLRNEIRQHLADRASLIGRLIETVESKETGQRADSPKKAVAIIALGDMRAKEAVVVLLNNIDFVNSYPITRAATKADIYPSLGALQKIGKPASQSSVAEIRDAHRFDVDGDENRRLSRIHLLTEVIVGVDGQDVARFILERELKNAEEISKPSFVQALEYLNKF